MEVLLEMIIAMTSWIMENRESRMEDRESRMEDGRRRVRARSQSSIHIEHPAVSESGSRVVKGRW